MLAQTASTAILELTNSSGTSAFSRDPSKVSIDRRRCAESTEDLEGAGTTGVCRLSTASQNAAAAFQANDKIDNVYGHNDNSTEGGYIAAKNANRDLSKLLFVGIDGLPDPDGSINSILQGRLSASYIYPTGAADAID